MSKWIARLQATTEPPFLAVAHAKASASTSSVLALLAPVPQAGTRNPVSAGLANAIARCCDVRGDDEANRAALLAESENLDEDMQAEMQQHFEDQARMWRRAIRGISP
jgi:hypothetical protein